MKISAALVSSLGGALGGALGALLASGAAAADRPPNLVFLLADDLRHDALGSYGNSFAETPELDRLAQEGVRFENVFVTTSICWTSRASIFTGQYARRHGVWSYQSELTDRQLDDSYPGRLKKAGYHIGFIGKYGVGNSPKDLFDFDRTFPGQGRYFVEAGGEQRHLTSVLGDQAIEFVRSAPTDRPFCLSLSFKAPHVQDSKDITEDQFLFDPALSELYTGIEIEPPLSARPEYFERLPRTLQDSEARVRWALRFWGPSRYQESVKSYYRLITGIDRVVGRLRATLDELELTDSTVIVFTSDNGFFLGEYGLAGKWTPHEPSIRIPLLVYDPRLSAESRGAVRPDMALNLDLAPTLLDLAGVEIPDAVQGRSLVPLLTGESESWRTSFFYEHHFDPDSVHIPKTEAVRTERWKYIRYVDEDPVIEELYDLRRDPRELDNLATREKWKPELERMRQAWTDWRERAR